MILPTERWGVIISTGRYAVMLLESPYLSIAVDHFGADKIIERMLASPDLFSESELFDIIYNEVGGAYTPKELEQMYETINKIYSLLYHAVVERLKDDCKNDSFEFKKWVSPKAALISSRTSKVL